VTINYNRITNCRNNGHAIIINGLHYDPHIAINWNEITNQYGQSAPSDAINIYRSSGLAGSPILIQNNYVQGVVPSTLGDAQFTGAGIVTDGDTADPALATANVEILGNQVVGCVFTGIALAFGLEQIAHDNTVVSSGLTPTGAQYAGAWLGICIEDDHRYQPAEWLKWLQLQNNTVGANNANGSRNDTLLWYPTLSGNYVQGNTSPHDGPITLADEQAQWSAWKSKLAANKVTVGP
jgi:hypothetical protein